MRLQSPFARAIAGVALILTLALALGACTPEQIARHMWAVGEPISTTEAEGIAEGIAAEKALNAAADHAARNNGAPGTCSETGIFLAESGGDWQAQNAGSTASGGYQFLDSTWANHRGYAKARLAPPWVQRERFLQSWAGGSGASHWTQSVC